MKVALVVATVIVLVMVAMKVIWGNPFAPWWEFWR